MVVVLIMVMMNRLDKLIDRYSIFEHNDEYDGD